MAMQLAQRLTKICISINTKLITITIPTYLHWYVGCGGMNRIELDKEMAWITFIGDGFEVIWHPITDACGTQLEWNSARVMDFCRAQFNTEECCFSFGIAPTSQMILKNAVRDNL